MKKRKIWTSLLLFVLLLGNVIPVHADAEEKKLYFEQQDGNMVWNAEKGSNGNWFMRFTNMVPGESYQDNMRIENGSKKTYDLYFQVIPLEQPELKDELLKKIGMTVTQDGKQIYKGNAAGEEGTVDLQGLIYLGTYRPSRESALAVDLTLDAAIGLEYNDLLTQIDWKFMVKEKVDSPKDTPVIEIKPPKTGDTTNINVWALAMLGSLALLAAVVAVSNHKRKMLRNNLYIQENQDFTKEESNRSSHGQAE
ncbi:hypothetical protein [Hespellia stercorisuis]|uniref:LPXTG-motif cell wall anchor domain-containing protein n=1 Tax=Hespellia stercorisuis DSM 15480 TaxID=1121950 RepID=A0A1M6I9M5_9FIRM|nr:hypothetical protein [Hespellia stercorisuis]SHJ31058.1 hypothetical protein SAMN02745243_00283 [Hespellia stercorisuis DSM 15480]